jgi:hypothetical protein
MHISKTIATLVLAMPMAAAAQEPEGTAPETQAPAAAAAPEATPPAPPAASAEPTIASAAPAPVAAAPSTPAPVAPVVTWEGLVDTYYLYNLTGDPSTQGPLFRQYDTNANSFTLNYAKLGLQAGLDPVSARVDVGYGLTGAGFFVQQAFGTVKLNSLVSLDAGKFVTHAGGEVIETNKNWLYSRSLLFFGIPAYHTGVRLNLAISPTLTAMLSVVNGWNNDPDENEGKTFGANVTYSANGITAAGTTYVGKEGAGASDYRLLLDGVFAIAVSDALSLAANLDFLQEGDANWFGVSVMAKAVLAEGLALAARGEFLKDKNLYGVREESLYEGTAMLGYTWAQHFEVRAEVRADLSSAEVFLKGTEPRKNQVTGLLGFLTYF